MKLTVKNFGPIREAKNIVVSPMTVFVGPSNTGKSYMAILIYSVMKVLEDGRYPRRFERQLSEFFEVDEDSEQKIHEMSGIMEGELPEKIDKSFRRWAELVSQLWKNEVVYCFGETANAILHNGRTEIVISDVGNELILNLISPEKSSFSKQKQTGMCNVMKGYLNQKHPYLDRMFGEHIYDFPKLLISGFLSTLLDGQYQKHIERVGSHYLPAIRGGIMQSHRTIVGALIQRAPMAGLIETDPLPPFSGVLSDFMEKLINFGSRSGMHQLRRAYSTREFTLGRSGIREIGKEMRRNIMEGEIDVRKSEVQYPDFRYVFERDGQKHDMPLMNASSMVSELAPISLFIDHHLRVGDLFIVEEPEAHLHPAAQREISRILVQLVNAGVYVLVTTHSENIIEQIGNYVCASEINEPIKGTSLKEQDISTYVFQRPKSVHKNTTVKKVAFDNETGFLTSDHMAVSSALYNETIELLEKRNPNE